MSKIHKTSSAGERKSTRARPARWLSVGFAVCLLLALTSHGLVGAGRTVRVGVYQNQPKIFMDENGQAAGFFIELLREIAAREGWNLVYVPCKWAECLAALTAGRIDLLPDMAYSPERAEIYDFHNLPVVESWSRVYVRSSASINHFSELEGKRVALLEGSIQQTVFTEMVAGFDYEVSIVPVQSMEAAFALVATDKADAAIVNKFFGDYSYQEYGLEETPMVLNATTLYYVTAHGQNHELLEAIDRHLNVWRGTPNSPYYTTLERWMEKPSTQLAPRYWRETIGIGAGALLLMVGGTLLLRKQVADRTWWLAQANAQLRETETTLRLTLEAANDGRWDWYPQTGNVLWDARSYAMLGYEPNAFPMTIERWGELLHPDDRKSIQDALQSSHLDATGGFSVESRYRRQDGRWIWINVRGKAVELDEKGEIQRVIGTHTDITERKQAEKVSQRRYQELTAVYDTSQRLRKLLSPELLAHRIIETLETTLDYTYGAVLLLDDATGTLEPFALSDQERGEEFVEADKAYVRSKGVRKGVGITGWVAEHGESVRLGDVREDPRYFSVRDNLRSELCVPLRLQDRVIGVINIESTKLHAYSADDQRLLENVAAQISVAIENARLYRQAEQEIAMRKQAEAALRAALQEREALLREVHHRVKNNLQVVCALLDLQALQADSPQLQELLEESGQRIRSMAHIHEQLTQAENLAQVDMATYIHNLVAALRRSYSMEWVAVDYAVEAMMLPFDLVSPCGLLINELVSNAFKHAFPPDWRGSQAQLQITLRVEPGSEARVRLTVADNGVGLPVGLDGQAPASLGLTLVKLLTRQLRGVLEIGGAGASGAVFCVTFPLPQQE